MESGRFLSGVTNSKLVWPGMELETGEQSNTQTQTKSIATLASFFCMFLKRTVHTVEKSTKEPSLGSEKRIEKHK